MANTFIPHIFNDSLIHQRVDDGYVNLNQLADATGTRIDNWLRLQGTKELIAEFEKQQTDQTKALITVKSDNDGGRSTWAHPIIAIQFAQWCSPASALQVSRWVREQMTTIINPLDEFDESRLKMTNQVKGYLEQIKHYDHKKYRGMYFAKVHDAINRAVTTETSKEMRNRISIIVGKEIKDRELIKDYFPRTVLSKYVSLYETTANLILKKDREPLAAVEEAAKLVLPADYVPVPIDFVEHIKNVRERVVQSLDHRRDELYKRLADK